MLLKESQFIVEDAVDQQISTVVSGTLDRLQSEVDDPCVRYDSEQKLWIYMHRRRKISDYQGLEVFK